MSETPVVASPLAIAALSIARQVALVPNLDNLTFQFAIDATAAAQDAFQVMDVISSVVDREKYKLDLAQREKAYAVAQNQPAELDKEIRRLQNERGRLDASLHAAHSVSNKRSDFKPTAQQKGALEQYEAQIAAAQASKANFKNDLPIIEYEIACLKAKISGEPEPEKPEAVERAQMGAVVAFSDAAD